MRQRQLLAPALKFFSTGTGITSAAGGSSAGGQSSIQHSGSANAAGGQLAICDGGATGAKDMEVDKSEIVRIISNVVDAEMEFVSSDQKV